MAAIEIPENGWYVLAGARIPVSLAPALAVSGDGDGLALADIAVADGRITGIAARADRPAPPRSIEMGGRIVLPAFVDCHTHLDKGHIWPRKPNPDGSFMGALDAAGADRVARWSSEDVARRMDFALRSAYAHGTKAIRTHLDSIPPQEDISWPVFEEMRARWKGRVELQAACLFGIEQARDAAWFATLVRRVAAARGGAGGGA